MCTVTFIPLHDTLYITHSRDESNNRPGAIAPKEYTVNGHTILFPRDTAAGGTWVGINKNGNAAALLNGAFTKHQHLPPYRKSRGLIFLDIIASNDLFVTYHQIDPTGIEPFTIILWNNGALYECRWDGMQKHVLGLQASQPHTWSSVTLYNPAIAAKRNTWFSEWLQAHPSPSVEDIINYHLEAGDGDPQNDLRMNRNDQLLTVSITSMEITTDSANMNYLDLRHHDTRSLHSLHFTKAAAIQ